MDRPKLRLALLLSVLLHAGLVIVFIAQREAAEARAAAQPKPSEWVVVDVPPLSPVEASKPPKVSPPPPPVVRRQLPRQTRVEKPEQAQVPQPQAASDQPRAEAPAPSAPISLFPGASLAPSDEVAEAPHGQTLHPEDLAFRPEVLRAEEEHRVKARVDGWALDQLAAARAQSGLPHPYFSNLGSAMRSNLDKHAKEAGITATTTQFMKSIGKRYADASSSYGKTGDPDLGPPGINPRQSEQLRDRFGSEPETMGLRMMVQAAETQNDLSHGKPLISLMVELRQFKDGRPLTAMVVQASSDAKFDAFVLDVWPRALFETGAPPQDAFHGPELRSLWAVEGWLGLPKKLQTAISYLPMPAIMGFGADKVLPALTEEGYHYEFRTRLLRLYQ